MSRTTTSTGVSLLKMQSLFFNQARASSVSLALFSSAVLPLWTNLRYSSDGMNMMLAF